MSEESITNPPESADPQGQQAPAPAAPPPDDPGEKRFTQDEVNALLAKERRKLERKTQAKQEPTRQKTEDEGNPVLDAIASLREELQSVKAETTKQREDAAFESAIAGVEGLAEEDRTTLRAMFNGKNVDKVRKFAEAVADQSKPHQGVTGKYNDPGAGVAAASGEPPTNPAELSKDDIARLQDQGRLREYLEKSFGVGPQNKIFKPKGFGKGKK